MGGIPQLHNHGCHSSPPATIGTTGIEPGYKQTKSSSFILMLGPAERLEARGNGCKEMNTRAGWSWGTGIRRPLGIG